jgi:hypothetical protein
MAADPIGLGLVKTVIDELVAMNYDGDVSAIAVVVVDRDGDLRTQIAYSPGTKLPLVAGVSILGQEIVGGLRSFQKDRDGR